MTTSLRGVFAIPASPFGPDGQLDDAELERAVAFSIEAGAHGLVGPVNVSEFTSLHVSERRRFVETMHATSAGQVPVVAAVHAPSTHEAVAYATHARQTGVDAVIAMPPYIAKARPEEIGEYYRAIATAAELPVFIQNFRPPLGTPLSAGAMADLLSGIEAVRYVKEETDGSSQVMTQLLAIAGEHLDGVVGGKAGRFIIDEHQRGACGTMPAQEFTDIHVALWNALESGDRSRARDIYRRLLPLLVMEGQYGGVTVCKEVLKRRGVLSSASVRQPGLTVLDEHAHRQLDALLTEIEDLFTTAPIR